MKKTYIAPAQISHQIQVESSLMANTVVRKAEFGHQKFKNDATEKYEYKTPLTPDVSQDIKPVWGDDVSNI